MATSGVCRMPMDIKNEVGRLFYFIFFNILGGFEWVGYGCRKRTKRLKMSAVAGDCGCVIFVYLSSHWCLIIYSKESFWISNFCADNTRVCFFAASPLIISNPNFLL